MTLQDRIQYEVEDFDKYNENNKAYALKQINVSKDLKTQADELQNYYGYEIYINERLPQNTIETIWRDI